MLRQVVLYPMTRYFLHVRDGDTLTEDPEGAEFASIQDARAEALQAARDLLAARLKAGEVVDGQKFEIHDEAGRILATVPFKEAIRFA